MSKAVTKLDKKSNSLEMQRHEQAVKKYANSTPPVIREVQPLPATLSDATDNPNGVITVYKDLNQPAIDFARNQQKNFIIALIVFFVLGFGILMGQKFGSGRGVASAELQQAIPAGVDATSSHYHYDKSCYTGKDGEQVCMTRTSQK